MKFVIKRTSSYGQEAPSEEARQEEFIRSDRRSATDPAQVPAYKGDRNWWYSEGTNHRIEDGMITRDMGFVKQFVIDFDSLEDLMEFNKKYGELVISNRDWNTNLPTIEIYDDYRE